MPHRTTLIGLLFLGALSAALPAGVWGFVRIDEKPPALAQAREIQMPVDDDPSPLLEDATEEPAPVAARAEIASSPEFPSGVALETTLASYSTRYHTGGRHRGRAHNVETAAEKLDGAIIPPHGTLSFNTHVGPRDRANGFRRAMVIDGGQLVPGMGGGVCQVASTLHAAALEGGLDMVQYRPHSRPSHYIPMGMDATVSFPQLDLEIANPFDFPVLVQSHAEDGEMFVELVGQARPREIQIARRVLNRRGYSERIIEDPTLALGTRIVDQRGIRGARVERIRTITENGETYTEREIVRYPPTDKIVRVGTGPVPSEHIANADGTIGPLALR